MNNVLWEISKRIIFEQRYQSLKGNTAFLSRFSGERKKGGRSLRSYIISNYIASVFSFALLSVALTTVTFSGRTSGNLSELEVVLYFYVFSANIFNTIIFLDGIVSENILQPLASIPLGKAHSVVPVAYMIYYGSSSIFVIMPFLLLEFAVNHSAAMFLTGTLWMAIYIVMGYLAGSLVFQFLYPLRNPSKPSLVKSIGTIFRIFVIVLVFSFFEIWIYDPQVLPAVLVPTSPGLTQYLVPVLNSPLLVRASLPMSQVLPGIFSPVLYIAVIFSIYVAFQKRLFDRIMVPRAGSSAIRKSGSFKHGNTRFAMFLKDLRIVFRKSQYSLMLFFPVMVSIPFAVPLILSNTGASSYNPLGLYYSLLSTISVICSSMYSILLFISEGGAVSVMFILPDFARRSVFSKASVGVFIFAAVVTPVVFVIMLAGRYSIFDYLLVPLNLVTGFSYTYLNLLNRFKKKLNPYLTVVNIDTFGGSFGLLLSFGFVLVLMVIPVVLGEIVSVYLIGNPGRTFNLAVDLIINSVFLLASVFIVGRQPSYASARKEGNVLAATDP